MCTSIGVSAVTLSIIDRNTTNSVRADIAAIEKIMKVEWRENRELDSSVSNQFDIRDTSKIWIKLEMKKSFSNWSILFTCKMYYHNEYSEIWWFVVINV